MSGFIKTFNSTLGPKAIGPYSTAKIFNGTLYVSGQIGIDPKTSELVSSDVELQARRALENLKIILSETGVGFEYILKSTIFLTVWYDLFSQLTILPKSTPSMQNTLLVSPPLDHAWLSHNYPREQSFKYKLSAHIPIKMYDWLNFIILFHNYYPFYIGVQLSLIKICKSIQI